MKTIIDERMQATKRDKEVGKEVVIDRNMILVHDPRLFTIDTSYSQHPTYPQIGHRVVYANTQSKGN